MCVRWGCRATPGSREHTSHMSGGGGTGAVPTGLTGRVKSCQQSPEASGEEAATRKHTFSLNGMFQSQLESQESLKVSFVSLNKDICDADVSVCKDEAERLSVCPEPPPQQPMLVGPQHIERPEGAPHTACMLSGLIPFI